MLQKRHIAISFTLQVGLCYPELLPSISKRSWSFIKTDLQGFWSVRKFRLLAIWCITNGRKLNVTEMLTPLNLNEFFRFFWQLRGRISFKIYGSLSECLHCLGNCWFVATSFSGSYLWIAALKPDLFHCNVLPRRQGLRFVTTSLHQSFPELPIQNCFAPVPNRVSLLAISLQAIEFKSFEWKVGVGLFDHNLFP